MPPPRIFRFGESTIGRRFAVYTGVCGLVFCMGLTHYYVYAGTLPNRDEAFTWRLIQYPAVELIHRTGRDVHPPLYYLLVKAWALPWSSPPTIDWLRCFSSVCANGSTLAALWLAVDISSKEGASVEGQVVAALTVTMFLFAGPMHLVSACTARMYSLGTLLTVLSTWLLYRSLNSEPIQRRSLGAYVFVAIALCYNHYYGLLAVVAQLVGAAYARFAAARSLRAVLIPGAIVGFGYLPWIPFLLYQLSEVKRGYWISTPSLCELSEFFISWCGAGSSHPALMIAVVAVFMFSALSTARNCCSVLVFQCLAPWCVSIAAICLLDRSVLQVRYLVFANAALSVQIAVIVSKLRISSAHVFAATTLTIVAVSSSIWHAANIHTYNDDAVRHALAYVRDRICDQEYIRATSLYDVNRIRLYAASVDMHDVQVAAAFPPANRDGHRVHLASLSETDVVGPKDYARGFWKVEIYTGSRQPIPSEKTFRSGATTCTVIHSPSKAP